MASGQPSSKKRILQPYPLRSPQNRQSQHHTAGGDVVGWVDERILHGDAIEKHISIYRDRIEVYSM